MKNTLNILFALLLTLTLAGAIGCATAPAEHSGFLENYSQLEPDPEGQLLYMAPTEKLKNYRSFVIDPVVVHFAPDAKGVSVNAENLATLSNHFHDEFAKAISESGRYQVVDSPGPGVARLRVAITDIEKSKVGMNVLPQTKMMGTGLGGASFEAEAVDSVSGERIAAVVDSKKGSRVSTAGLKTYGDAQAVMTKWAERFVMRLDTAHGWR